MTDRARALVYIRKSLVRTGSDTISPERQREACLAEAARHGWHVSERDVYVDAEGHQSGKDDSRPGWLSLQQRIRTDATVAAVIVESLSRASRSVRSFLEFVDELKQRGITLVSLKERFDTSTAIGQAMLGFIAIINQLESDLAAERMKGQIEYRKRHGRHWGYTPFGCEREPVTGALKPSVETYRLDGAERGYHDSLARCYELYSGGELGFDRLAGALNAEGWRFRTRQGQARRWDRNNARSVVAMCRVYEGYVPLDAAAKDKPTEWVTANYEAVLPVELCQGVERVWRRRAGEVWHPTPPNVRDSDYILTGVLHCAGCGQRLKGERCRSSHARQYRHTRAKEGCRQRPFDADALEAQALALLTCFVLPDEVLQEVAALIELEQREPDALEAKREDLAAQLRRRESETERLVELAVATDLDSGVYRRQVERLSAEVGSLRQQLADLEHEIANTADARTPIIERLRRLGQAVGGTSPDVQKETLASVFERLEAGGEEIRAVTPKEWCRPFWCGH